MRRPVLTLLLICAFTYGLGLGGPAITDSDEAFYAEASREMVESGDWLTPRFNYEDRWQKPVLYYWLTSATYLVTGPTESAARLWSALAGAGLVLLTWAAAGAMSRDADTGWLAGAIVATCFGYFTMARAALPDLPLAFAITLGIWATFAAVDRGAGGRATAWWAIAGLGAGLGFLLKGPVALVIPAIVLLPIAWRERRQIAIPPSGVAVAAAVFAIVGLPWYGAMLAEHGAAYARSFFVGDNLERFATDRFNDPRPFWFYAPVVFGGMAPWSAYLAAFALGPTIDIVRRRRSLSDLEWRLVIWAALPLLFYTISIGKQPRYILPVLPPLAILLAISMMQRIRTASRSKERPAAMAIATWATAAIVAAAAVFLIRVAPPLSALPIAVTRLGAATLGLCAAGLAVIAARRLWPRLPLALVASGTLLILLVQFTLFGRPRPEPVEAMAALVARHRTTGERIGVYRAFVRNLVFYTHVRQEDLYDEERALAFVKSPERVLLVLPADEVAFVEEASGVRLHPLEEVAYVNTANIRLRTFLGVPESAVTRVLLVTNR